MWWTFLLALIPVALAVFITVRKIRRGSSCCGEREEAAKRIRVRDKDTSHYSYSYKLTVDGMHCSNCVRNVENSLNALDGLWATASLEKKEVTVLSKKEMDFHKLERTVAQAGYTVLSCM